MLISSAVLLYLPDDFFAAGFLFPDVFFPVDVRFPEPALLRAPVFPRPEADRDESPEFLTVDFFAAAILFLIPHFLIIPGLMPRQIVLPIMRSEYPKNRLSLSSQQCDHGCHTDYGTVDRKIFKTSSTDQSHHEADRQITGNCRHDHRNNAVDNIRLR